MVHYYQTLCLAWGLTLFAWRTTICPSLRETIWPNNQLVIGRGLAISCLLPVPNTTQIAGDVRSKLCEASTDKIAEGFD